MMFKKRKDTEIDFSSLNDILSIGKKLFRIFYAVTIIVLVVLATYLLKEWKILNFLGEFLIVISPIFIGFIIAWLFEPAVSWLQKRKVPRIVGSLIVYILFLGTLFLLIYLFLPTFGSQIKDFVGEIPGIVSDIKGVGNRFFEGFNNSGINVSSIKNQFYDSIETLGNNLTTELPNKLFGVAKSFVNVGILIVFGLLIGFYMLYDFDKLNDGIERFIPNKWLDNYNELVSRINTSLRKYVQGVLLIMLLVFMTQSVGLTIAGLKAPLIFALFCAITDIIPYFGPYIGAIPAIIVGFTISPFVGIACIIAIVIVQLIENYFYQPLIMGHTMKLHPVTIIIGLLIFEHFFGIIGMVVATPVVACLKVIVEFIDEKTHIFSSIKFGRQVKESKVEISKNKTVTEE